MAAAVLAESAVRALVVEAVTHAASAADARALPVGLSSRASGEAQLVWRRWQDGRWFEPLALEALPAPP